MDWAFRARRCVEQTRRRCRKALCVSHRYHAALNDALALQRIEPETIDLLISIRQIFVYFDCCQFRLFRL